MTNSGRAAVSLYIHYPFCVRKCQYCDFFSEPADPGTRSRYLEALEREISDRAGLPGPGDFPGSPCGDHAGGIVSCPHVDSIYFGGGTPSLMDPSEIRQILSVIREHFLVDPEAEITMECNPGTADEEKLSGFRSAGINRISIGIQSFRNEELRMLGRIHTAEQAAGCVEEARSAGFSNLSLDLISALPGQTYEEWMTNLRQAADLEPDHISSYSLILEEGTPLKARYDAGLLPELPDEDTDRKMYHDTKSFLEERGYHRYEISSYARKGFECRHNIGYWSEHPYLGFGPGAASYLVLMDGRRVRWSSRKSVEEYCSNAFPPEEDPEYLTLEDQMGEFMFLGLRKMEGVSGIQFRRRFGHTLHEIYGNVIHRYEALGLLEEQGDRLFLTDSGIDVSNTVMADFLLD